LVEENDYAFYIAAPDKPEKGRRALQDEGRKI
jgi:hypothetical protein